MCGGGRWEKGVVGGGGRWEKGVVGKMGERWDGGRWGMGFNWNLNHAIQEEVQKVCLAKNAQWSGGVWRGGEGRIL